MNFHKKILTGISFLLLFVVSVFWLMGCSRATAKDKVTLVNNEKDQKVEVFVNGKPFTSYIYSDKIDVLKKPVLYPLRTANGTKITRYYPLEQRAGERVDHPHHIGFWLNYGNVNGFDFWNNSNAIPPERAPRMGVIRHRAIKSMKNGEQGILEIVADWIAGNGKKLLTENTRFVFSGDKNLRIIDRITTLTALDEKVNFTDNKEGFVAIRVTRALEHPTDKPIKLSDASGKVTDVPVLDNTGVTGKYYSSEGKIGTEVWGTRAKWVMLSGIVEGEKVSVAIFDHPDNVGYPTYWHARPYGLFAANPLGQKIFSKGKEELNFALNPGESVTFKYRVVIRSGETTPEQMEALYNQFVK